MPRFNRSLTFSLLTLLLIALLAIRWAHGRVEGRYQERTAVMATYTFDDWLDVLGLDELLGDPAVTPAPIEEILGATPSP